MVIWEVLIVFTNCGVFVFMRESTTSGVQIASPNTILTSNQPLPESMISNHYLKFIFKHLLSFYPIGPLVSSRKTRNC